MTGNLIMILDGSPKGEKAWGLKGNTEGPTPKGAFNRGCPRNCRRRVSAPRMPLGNREGGRKPRPASQETYHQTASRTRGTGDSGVAAMTVAVNVGQHNR